MLAREAPGPVVVSLLMGVVSGCAPAVTASFVGVLVDRLPAGRGGGDLVGPVVVLAVLLAFSEVGRAAHEMATFAAGERFRLALTTRVMTAVGRLPGLRCFDDPEIARRLEVADWAGTGPTYVVEALWYSVYWGTACLSAAVVGTRLVWWAPLPILVPAMAKGLSNWSHSARQATAQVGGVDDRRRADYHYQVATGREHAAEVRLFGLGSWLVDRQSRFWRRGVAEFFAGMRRQSAHDAAFEAARFVFVALPFLYAFTRLGERSPDAGDLTAALLALGALATSARGLEEMGTHLQVGVRFLPDAFAVMDLPPSADPLVVTGTLRPPTMPESGIRFEGVSFSYPSGQPVLRDLDLFLPAARSVALVGNNGAGKSTVVKLLCRLYDPDTGRITLDGTDLREFDLAELRSRFAVVLQDFVRYPFTAADNVGLGCVTRLGEADLIDEAARSAGADRVVEGLEDGWDTVLAPEFGGVDLSGGQWQRIGLARALATRIGNPASILVLDEPTASLDLRVEHDLYRRFSALAGDCLTLLVSHRLATVRMADSIALLEGGRVTEAGDHDKLVIAGGRYAELFGLQARRFGEQTES